MFHKVKDFLGVDIKTDKYKKADDKLFGKISNFKTPDEWVRSTCGYCGVGYGLYIGVKDGRPVYTKGDPAHPVSNKFKAIQAEYGKGAVACISTGQFLTEDFYTLGKFV